MFVDNAVVVAQEMLWTAFLVAMPLLLTALLVGVGISLLQTVTGVQEMTLTFVPKILGVVAAVFLFLPWMTNILLNFARAALMALAGG